MPQVDKRFMSVDILNFYKIACMTALVLKENDQGFLDQKKMAAKGWEVKIYFVDKKTCQILTVFKSESKPCP